MSLVVMKRVILFIIFGHPTHKRQGEGKSSQRIVYLGI